MRQKPETMEEFRYKLEQMARDKGSFAPGTANEASREFMREANKELTGPKPDWFEAAMAEDEADIMKDIETRTTQRTVGSSTYWDDMSEFMAEAPAVSIPPDGAAEARDWGYTQRWGQRGQAARQALGKLGQRAMAIPGVEQASVIGRTAGRYLGPALGVAGPVFDAMAIKELSDQYGEAKEGIKHMEASRMHTANKYATPLAAKQTRKGFDRLRARAEQETDMVRQAVGAAPLQMTPAGETLYTMDDGTMVSSDNLREMQARENFRTQKGY